MKTLRIILCTVALLVGVVIVAHSARAVIIFGTPIDSAKSDAQTTGLASSNYLDLAVSPLPSDRTLWEWTFPTNYPPAWQDLWATFRPMYSTNGTDFNLLSWEFGIGDGNSCQMVNLGDGWFGLTSLTNVLTSPKSPVWLTTEMLIDGGSLADFWYPTNVLNRTEVTPIGVLAQQMFGMSQNGSTIATGSAADTNGNIYTCGYWSGQATFGAVVTNTPGPTVTYGYLVKYNSAGVVQWFKSFFPTNPLAIANINCRAVDVDSAGNIVLIGNIQDVVDFGAGPVTAAGAADGFCAKYDSSGGLGWVQHWGNQSFDVGKTLSIDSTNGIYIANSYWNGVSLGFSLKKLSTTIGATIWTTNNTGSYWTHAIGVAVDSNNCPIVTGYVEGTSVNLGGGTLTATGLHNIILAKYSATDGAYQWGKCIGTSSGNRGYAVTTDTNRNVILTGLFSGTINLGGGNINGGSIYVVGYDPNGAWLWNYVTGAGSDSGAAVRVSGNKLVVAGRCASGIYFPGMSLSLFGNGQVNFWIASFTLSGTNAPTHVWSKLTGYGVDGAANANGLCFDSAGRVVTVGAFMATLDFGLGPVTATGYGYPSGFTLWYGN